MQPRSPHNNPGTVYPAFLDDSASAKTKWMACLAGFGAVLGLFVVIPFTQLIHFETSREIHLIDMMHLERENPVVENVVSTEVTRTEPLAPVMEYSEPVLEISLLDLQLKPAFNAETVASMSQNFLDQVIQDAGNYQGILGFDDLAHPPSIVYLPDIRFPDALVAQDIIQGEVVVTIVIDEEGRASCEKVQSSSHPLLEELVRNVVRKTRFSVSVVDGQPVKVRGTWPLTLRAPG